MHENSAIGSGGIQAGLGAYGHGAQNAAAVHAHQVSRETVVDTLQRAGEHLQRATTMANILTTRVSGPRPALAEPMHDGPRDISLSEIATSLDKLAAGLAADLERLNQSL